MPALPAPPTGRLDGPLHLFAVRVYHEDTDATGGSITARTCAGSSARSDILELLGIDQRAAIERGDGFYVVSELAIRYLAPALLGDTVIIETTCREARSASARMTQVAIQDGARLCVAQVRVGFVGPDGRAKAQPQAWRSAFASIVTDTERL
jgi:acyl-CoA thioester hydrolase